MQATFVTWYISLIVSCTNAAQKEGMFDGRLCVTVDGTDA